MNIVDRFSTNVHEVLGNSIKMATQLNHLFVEPIHIFLALANQKGCLAYQIMADLKIDLKTIDQELANLSYKNNQLEIGQQKKTNSTTQILISPLSEDAKKVIEKAMMMASDCGHNFVGTEHILSGILSIDNPQILNILKKNKIKKGDLIDRIDESLENAGHLSQMSNTADMASQISNKIFGEENNLHGQPLTLEKTASKKNKTTSVLEMFATNLNNAEIQKNIDPLVGRDEEVERLIQILHRRNKNNPILLGNPGVGKTAIVEGLAKKIYEGIVPTSLLNKKIYSLDMGLLIAGTIYRGEFESRLKKIVEEVINNTDIILFIDEIHNIVGAGSQNGTMDAGNILKPALARGQIRCIGATTPEEYKKHIENDPALERRFQPILIKEPTLQDTVGILKGIRKNYEKYHQVQITDEIIELMVELSHKYINNKFLPDKAIDLLDETSAAKKLQIKPTAIENEIIEIKKQLEKIIADKEKSAQNGKYDQASKYKKEEQITQTKIKNLEKKLVAQNKTHLPIITTTDVVSQISKITGLDKKDFDLSTKNSLNILNKKIKKQIVGQDETIDKITDEINRARLNLKTSEKPLASFLFVGKSGVGKTELAKVLASTLYPKQDALIHLNMSEFSEGFGVSKLLGSPAGYVGYKENNQFTDKIKLNPHAVVLFDDIDKAHKDVVKLLLQILDNGYINDSTGKKISFKHAIIILTTNVCSEELEKTSFGFDQEKKKSRNILEKQLTDSLKKYFSGEIINRLGNICIFNNLNETDMIKIAKLEIDDLNEKLKQHHTAILYTNKILAEIIKQKFSKNTEARELRRTLREILEKNIAQHILNNKTTKEYELSLNNKEINLK